MDRSKLLELIQARIDSYPPGELMEKLHSYGNSGPTVDEMIASFNLPDKKPDEHSVTQEQTV